MNEKFEDTDKSKISGSHCTRIVQSFGRSVPRVLVFYFPFLGRDFQDRLRKFKRGQEFVSSPVILVQVLNV